MKIIELRAENVKRLKAVTIKPKGPVVQITGKNGSGKTSVLDSIWWALGGKDDIQAVPIRKGAEKGIISLDLGDLIVERRFNASGTSTLSVRNKADGATHQSPQKMLDALIGRLSFDPLAFAKKRPREQYDEIKSIAKVAIDLDALEAANKADFEKRTLLNRRAKELRAQADGIAVPDTPLARIDVSSLAAAMEKASRDNAALALEAKKREDAQASAAMASAHAERVASELPEVLGGLNAQMEAAIKAVQDKFSGLIQAAENSVALAREEAASKMAAVSGLKPLAAPIDIGSIRSKIEESSSINRQCDLQDQRAKLLRAAAEFEQESFALTAAMASREAQKVAALQAAEMPVQGLSLGDGIVMLDGLPLDQASDAQQLRLSVAVAMAANPKLRVIRIRDGSLLDEDGLAVLQSMAAEREFQVWIERVDSSGEVGIVMVDGEVSADLQEEQ